MEEKGLRDRKARVDGLAWRHWRRDGGSLALWDTIRRMEDGEDLERDLMVFMNVQLWFRAFK